MTERLKKLIEYLEREESSETPEKVDLREYHELREIFSQLDEQHVKSHGMVIDIHKYDADPFPSTPHGHWGNRKIHLGNGDIYQGKNVVGNIGKKALKGIYSKMTMDPPK